MWNNDWEEEEGRSESGELIRDYENAIREKRQPFFDQDGFEAIIDYYEDQHEVGKAMEAVDFAILHYPFSGVFFIRKAQLLINLRKFEEATELLNKAESLDPDELSLHLTKSDLFVWQGKHQEAIKLLKHVISECEPEDKEDLYLELADVYEDCERYDKVVDCLKRAIEMNPTSEEALNRLWFCTELTENYEEMLPFYKELVDENPYSAMGWFNLAHAYAGLELWQEAIESFEFVLAIDDKFEDAFIDCADVYFTIKSYRKAIELYKEAAQFPRPNKEVYFQIGQCYEKLKDLNKARSFYRKSTQIDPEYDEAYFRIGETYKLEKRYVEALSSMERANKLYPDNVFYIRGLASIQLNLGNLEEAISLFDKIINLDGSRKSQWIDFSAAVYLSGDKKHALEVLDLGLKKFKKKAELFYAKSAMLYDMGRKQESMDNLSEALSLKYKRYSLIFGLNKNMRNDADILELIALYKP